MAPKPVIHAVDDDRCFREALERTLRTTGHCVQGYSCASAFLEALDPSVPGCLITDLRMPDMNGLELQRTLREREIRLAIVFISGHGDTTQAIAALKSGAIDFLEKPFGEQALLRSVARALEKDSADRRLAGERALVMQRFSNLTRREQQIFALIVSDLPNKEIARQLRISPRTVEHHRERAMLKMQAQSFSELITMSVLCGIREIHLALPQQSPGS